MGSPGRCRATPADPVPQRLPLDGTHPFKWDGQDANLNISLTSTVKRLGGSGISQADARDLQAFLTGLPAPRTPTVDDAQAVARGKDSFESSTTGCLNCHDGEMSSDGKRHDLAVDLDAVDTPSLIGLANSAPYYHDGSAVEMVDRAPQQRHGALDGPHVAARRRADRRPGRVPRDAVKPAHGIAPDHRSAATSARLRAANSPTGTRGAPTVVVAGVYSHHDTADHRDQPKSTLTQGPRRRAGVAHSGSIDRIALAPDGGGALTRDVGRWHVALGPRSMAAKSRWSCPSARRRRSRWRRAAPADDLLRRCVGWREDLRQRREAGGHCQG